MRWVKWKRDDPSPGGATEYSAALEGTGLEHIMISTTTTSMSHAQFDNVPPWLTWLTGTPGVTLAFLWGFAEGTLFFILPDVPLSLAAMFRPRRALIHLAAIVAGALLAGAVMFSWAARGPTAREAVAHVPLVIPAMFESAESDYRQFGIWAAGRGPVRGIPYKVYAVEAPEHSRLWPFLLVSIPARIWRLFVVWLVFAGAGLCLRKLRRASLVPALHALFWIGVYVVYWAKVN